MEARAQLGPRCLAFCACVKAGDRKAQHRGEQQADLTRASTASKLAQRLTGPSNAPSLQKAVVKLASGLWSRSATSNTSETSLQPLQTATAALVGACALLVRTFQRFHLPPGKLTRDTNRENIGKQLCPLQMGGVPFLPGSPCLSCFHSCSLHDILKNPPKRAQQCLVRTFSERDQVARKLALGCSDRPGWDA